MVASVLNPNAPIFVPSAYRAVEDFSDQWWDLVHSSPWFRDYWLQECFSDPEIDSAFFHVSGDDVYSDEAINDSVSKRKGANMDLVALELLKWRKPHRRAQIPRYCGKAPKIVCKARPRPIQQPR